MKRALVLLALVAACAAAGSAEAVAPPGVSVAGAGSVTWPDTPTPGVSTTERAIVHARVLSSGEPFGSIANVSPFGINVATVTCIDVVGDTVYVGGRLRPGFDLYNGETFAQMAYGVRDGDRDGDLLIGAIFRRSDIDPCQRLSLFPAVVPLRFGNFVVRGH